MFAPGVPHVLQEFGSTSQTLATFVVSVYLIGLAFGPLIIAPLSEIYGRYWIYCVSNVMFIVFAIACAESKNMGQLIAFRFLHGIAGVAPLTIGGGTISDIMPVEKRGGGQFNRTYIFWSFANSFSYGHMGYGTSSRTCGRPCRRRLPRSGHKLAMGVLSVSYTRMLAYLSHLQ
jgi:MFS family permease